MTDAMPLPPFAAIYVGAKAALGVTSAQLDYALAFPQGPRRCNAEGALAVAIFFAAISANVSQAAAHAHYAPAIDAARTAARKRDYTGWAGGRGIRYTD